MATRKWKLRLHISQVANQARSYASLGSMKGLGILLLPHGGMLLHCRVNRPTFIHLSGESTLRPKCLAREHNAMS